MRIAQVGAEFEAVVAVDLGDVIDELNLPLALRQRAIALVDAESVPELWRRPGSGSWMSKAGMPEV